MQNLTVRNENFVEDYIFKLKINSVIYELFCVSTRRISVIPLYEGPHVFFHTTVLKMNIPLRTGESKFKLFIYFTMNIDFNLTKYTAF